MGINVKDTTTIPIQDNYNGLTDNHKKIIYRNKLITTHKTIHCGCFARVQG